MGPPFRVPFLLKGHPKMPTNQFLRSAAAIVAATAALAAPAFAGGFAEPIATPVVTPVVVAPPPAMRMSDWRGGYVGIEGFGTQTTFDADPDDTDFDGDLFGIFAGYRFSFGRFVVGGELAYDTGEIDFDILGATLDQDVTRAGVQVGFDAGRLLPYLTAGYTNVEFSEGGDSIDFDGSFAGVGVDYAVTNRFTVGAQYLVHDFEDSDGEFLGDFQTDALGLRAAYNF
jgi:outer membrane immunogenic protein